MSRIAILASFFWAAAHAPAQLAVGDMGVTGFLSSQFTVMHATGTSVAIGTGSFGGTSHAILWDDAQPNTFLVGGVGFLGRITMTGPTSATYAPITSSVGIVAQMSFDQSRLIVVCDSGANQFVLVDPVSGAVTPITAGAQPWGADLNAGCVDRDTGDIFAGGNNAIWRIPAGTSTASPYASGWTAGSSYVSGIVIDPSTLLPVATLLTVNRVARIAATGVLTNLCPPGSVPGPNALDVDANGDFVVAATLGQIHRVPNGGGTPVLIGTATGITGAGTGIAAVARPFMLTAQPLGLGGFSIGLDGIPPGTVEGLTVPSFDVGMPVGSGPVFGLSPDAVSLALVLAAPVAGPGNIVHWSWPVPFPTYPAAPIVAPAGTLPPGLTVDLLAVAVNSGFFLRPAPVVRLTIN
jgi:hypothetical protein